MHVKNHRRRLLAKVPVDRNEVGGDFGASFRVAAVVENAVFARPGASW